MKRGLPLLAIMLALVVCAPVSEAAQRSKHHPRCKVVKVKKKNGKRVKRRVCKPKRKLPPPSKTAQPSTPADPGPTQIDPGAVPPGPGVTPPPASRRVVGYFTSWGIYGRNYQPTDIPAAKLTDINYAFANVSSDGRCAIGDPWADTDKPYPGDASAGPHGNFNQLNVLKQSHPDLRTHISVGGWTWSGSFSDAALTESSRSAFAQSCVALMHDYGFDGIDIDWEYPVGGGQFGGRPQDKQNYTALLHELRTQLDALGQSSGRHYDLTIAAPAGSATAANIELSTIAADLDWINLMSYDYTGAWSAQTGFNAPLYGSPEDPQTADGFDVDATVANYLASGVPAAKLVVGVPFYARTFAGVAGAGNGLFQNFTGAGPGTYEPGMVDFRDLQGSYGPGAGYAAHYDATAKVPWLYNPTNHIFVSYDDPTSIGEKAQYVRSHDLGGVMIWELSGDSDSHALLDAVNTGLAPAP